MKITFVLGTRPEIIKMSPVIRECERLGLDFFVLHTGQHYSYNMDRVFFDQLKMPDASYNLDVGSGSHGVQTGKMLIGIEKVLVKEEPDVVLVQGDTNTVLAGALAASKLNIPLGHVESGLRCYDYSMPEEINRCVVDHLSDFLFAPTEFSRKVLVNEGISNTKIFLTGNTVVDAIYQNLAISKDSSDVLNKLGLESRRYFLVTLHRQENVDDRKRLADVARAFSCVKDEFGLDLVYPIHPRTRKCITSFGITFEDVKCVDPLDYFSFLHLQCNARLVLTDSGGVQEEACVLKIPCVTLRDKTERPETIHVGSNVLAGIVPEKVVALTKKMMSVSNGWANPFGDGSAANNIIQVLRDNFK
jgi:UDP-N-acetylglucosamine 2-epimerase (non-hydrolysing)